MTGRRRILRAATVVAVLVLLSGCLVTGPAGQKEATVGQHPSATAIPTTTPTATDATATPSATPTTVTPGLAVPAEDRLVLNATGPLNLTVTMYESEDATGAVANASYEFPEPGELHVTEFEPSGWVVVRMNGDEIWADYVNSAEHYEVEIAPDGTAETASYYVK